MVYNNNFEKYNEQLDKIFYEIEKNKKEKLSNYEKLSRVEKDKIFENQYDLINKFHEKFIFFCEDIMQEVAEKYMYELTSNKTILALERETHLSIDYFVNYWKDKLNPYLVEKFLFEKVGEDKRYRIKNPVNNYVKVNDDKIYLNTEVMWNYILKVLNKY